MHEVEVAVNTSLSSTGRMKVRVTKKNVVADSIVELVLADPDGNDLPAWSPGAHIGLSLDEGLVRQYSLCGDVKDRSSYRVAVLREPESRGGSVFVHDKLGVGDLVDVMEPRNNFELLPAGELLFVAGGIGLTPLIPMIAEAESRSVPWRLVYGGRSRGSMAYIDELESRYGTRVTAHPQDVAGILPLAAILDDLGPDTLVYCCGPEGLLGAIEAECTRRDISRALHIERFSPKEEDPALAGTNQTFEVELKQAGVTLEVPADKSILEVVEEAGIPVDSSCRDGTCATCETHVLEGKCDHRDSLLSEDERESNTTMMICVSRALGNRIVLDL
ncbi:PDR/VanB family oxidoreductase [Gordonia sp. DT30]|uniref:PDR/VanB family oxidoreductase n=1 Tax=Gordonia sp. DT30 TaxID=3416546 RepID=UPI003CEBEB02